MKKKIIIGVSATVIVIAAIAAGVITGVSSKKKSSNDINVSCKAVVTKNDDITRELRKYFKIDKVDENWPDSIYALSNTEYENESVRFYLPNTATLNIKFINDKTFTKCTEEQVFCHPVAEVLLDVNGDKRPNTIGKDIYSLFLGEDGVLYPNGSEAVNKYDSETYPLWDSELGCQGKNPTTNGLACAARVVEEGFKINY